jgi:hypothetical protein
VRKAGEVGREFLLEGERSQIFEYSVFALFAAAISDL